MARSKFQLKIGEKLKAFRQSKNLSGREFAKVLGVTAGYISQIEVGRLGVSATLLLKIKKAYPDTDMNEFFKEG